MSLATLTSGFDDASTYPRSLQKQQELRILIDFLRDTKDKSDSSFPLTTRQRGLISTVCQLFDEATHSGRFRRYPGVPAWALLGMTDTQVAAYWHGGIESWAVSNAAVIASDERIGSIMYAMCDMVFGEITGLSLPETGWTVRCRPLY